MDTVDLPWAWIALDEHDSDLATFVSYLLAALRSVYPDAGHAVETLLRSPALPAPSFLADALLSDLAALPGPWLLVLDDYHALQSLDVHAVMRRVVQHLPDPIHVALTTRADPPLIDAIQGENGPILPGADFVAELRRANLFLTPLDDQGAWYRYHHLFQQLLRNRLRQAYGEVEIRTMHARASAWFASQGLLDEAIVHALLAEDPLQAASLVECHIHKALDREEWRQLERWIGLLPAAMRNRPRLLLAQAWLSFIRFMLNLPLIRVERCSEA